MYELIEHRKLDANTASIMFSNIPNTYTDLALFCSTRANYGTESYFKVEPNETSANTNMRVLYGDGAAAYPFNYTNRALITFSSGSVSTSNTFGNTLFYIANYASSVGKSVSMNSVGENNATTAYQIIGAGLWNNTAVIDRLNIVSLDANGNNGGNFVANSSFTLYGVNRTSGIGRAPLAMGGYMSYSNGYWVHTFPSSGSFIPFTNMDVEYLVVAGGGGGGFDYGGGGGAGGFRSGTILNLTASTNYLVTVGAGGSANGGIGSNSVFSTITSNGGGGGGTYRTNGTAGGSGGGGGSDTGVGGAGNTPSISPSQGNSGGNGGTNNGGAAGGGGSSTTGFNGATTTSGVGGDGGSGTLISITGSPLIFAGGGGGGAKFAEGGTGTGGGGNGGRLNVRSATSGTANTGGGGGGGASDSFGSAGSGGSGIVIVRYRA